VEGFGKVTFWDLGLEFGSGASEICGLWAWGFGSWLGVWVWIGLCMGLWWVGFFDLFLIRLWLCSWFVCYIGFVLFGCV